MVLERCEVDAYVCGVRFSQAGILTRGDSSRFSSNALQVLAMDRLIHDFDAMASSCSLAPDPVDRAREVVLACWREVKNISPQSLAEDDAFKVCHQNIQAIGTWLRSVIPTGATAPRIQDSFEAGIEVAQGEWNDPRDSMAYKPGETRTEPTWTVDNEDRLADLLRRLAVSRDQLIPPRACDGSDDPFPELPSCLNGWYFIEAGLQDLRAADCSAGVPSQLKPVWNKSKQQLRYGDAVIRKVRVGRAKNVVSVLDKFQKEKWPEKIVSPLEPHQVNDTRKSLNKRLKRIRFRMETQRTKDGKVVIISWDSSP